MSDPAPLASSLTWLLLIHQLPPKPAYLRVKVWRRLQKLGAVAIKSSVYALPNGEAGREDFQWLLSEIEAGGGEGSVCEARFVDGLSDEQIRELFNAARKADYHELAAEVRTLSEELAAEPDTWRESLPERQAQLTRLRGRTATIAAIDFFGAPGREALEGLLGSVEARLAAAARLGEAEPLAAYPAPPVGRIWVTRAGVHVDRIASAWLIRRFIDPDARFRFVAGKGYRPEPGEVRFDMFEAEFTHEGDACTFEVLLARAGLDDPALGAIAEIVHDIDLKDAKFGREETAGVARLIVGIARPNRSDEERLARGAMLFDELYTAFGGR